MPADTRLNFGHAQFPEPLGDERRRVAFVHGETRMCVQVAAPLRQLSLNRGVHRVALPEEFPLNKGCMPPSRRSSIGCALIGRATRRLRLDKSA